jgi:hypothetical protein
LNFNISIFLPILTICALLGKTTINITDKSKQLKNDLRAFLGIERVIP